MFSIKNDVNFLYECGFQKGDIDFLYKEFKEILLELNEDYLDYIKNQEESVIEKFLKKVSGTIFCYNFRRYEI